MLLFILISYCSLSGLSENVKTPYESWKSDQLADLKLAEIRTLAKKVLFFTGLFKANSKEREKVHGGSLERESCSTQVPEYTTTFVKVYEHEMLYSYNYLREMLGQKVAASIEEISKKWVDEVARAAYPYSFLENGVFYQPTMSVVDLLEHSRRTLNLREEVFAFLDSEPANANSLLHDDKRYSISLPPLPDSSLCLFILYHEFAHVLFKDIETEAELENHNRDVPQLFLDASEFQKYVGKIEEYKKLAQETINTSTKIGRTILKVLSEHSLFWEIPVKIKLYRTLTLLRGQEMRADLFACEKLYEQGMIEPIIKQISYYVLSGYTVALDYDEHPSHFERSLYMLGFLISKGMDINSLLQKDEQQGTCVFDSTEPAIHFSSGLFPHINEEGGKHFYKAYAEWQSNCQKKGYRYWKEERESVWRSEGIEELALQKLQLLSGLVTYMYCLEQLPNFTPYKTEALYSHTMLRDLFRLKRAPSLEKIDLQWVQKQFPSVWKAAFFAENDLERLPDKCYSLVWLTKTNLIEHTKRPEWPFPGKIALWSYNLLRELRGLKGVKSLAAIDSVWLEKEDFRSFKESTEQGWAATGNDDRHYQTTYLRDQLQLKIPMTEMLGFAYRSQAEIMHLTKMLKKVLPDLPEVMHLHQVDDAYLDLINTLIEKSNYIL